MGDDRDATTTHDVGAPNFGRATQADIYRAGAFGRRPAVPTNPAALVAAAREAMSERAWAYVDGSAGSEDTARENLAAFRRWRIVPRMLADISTVDTTTSVLGTDLRSPFLFAPVGALEIVDDEGDLGVAAAARTLGVPMVISTQGSSPMEDTARMLGDTPPWYQLYWSRDDELVTSFVRRAEAIGARALVVTLDTPGLGWRTRDLDLAHLPFIRNEGIAQYTSDDRFAELVDEHLAASADDEQPRPTVGAVRTLVAQARAHPGALLDNLRSPRARAAAQTFIDVFVRADLTWDDLAWLRERTRLPIVLKGIQHVDDARRAVAHGMDGIVVSNHGGRQVDGAVASLDALPGIVDAVGSDLAVLFDSGVRTGADAFTALALGAEAVLVGRPWVYGLGIAGRRGAHEVMRNLLAEFDLTMALAGVTTIAGITRDRLVHRDVATA